jgi:hypothetical protein
MTTHHLTTAFSDNHDLNEKAAAVLRKHFQHTGAQRNLLRVAAASERHVGINSEGRKKRDRLTTMKRDLLNRLQDREREVRHNGWSVLPAWLSQEMTDLRNEIEVINEQLEEIANRPQSVNLPVETLLEELLDVQSDYVNAPLVKIPTVKGSYADAVAAIRSDLAAIKSKAAAVRKRLLPESEALQHLKDQISAMALPLDVSGVTRMTQPINETALATRKRKPVIGQIKFPVRSEVFANGRLGELPEAYRFMCAVMPDQIFAHGKTEPAKIYKSSGPGLSVADRDRALADLAAEALQIERLEEAVISAAEDHGDLHIWRRPDADWRAVLGVHPKKL